MRKEHLVRVELCSTLRNLQKPNGDIQIALHKALEGSMNQALKFILLFQQNDGIIPLFNLIHTCSGCPLELTYLLIIYSEGGSYLASDWLLRHHVTASPFLWIPHMQRLT